MTQKCTCAGRVKRSEIWESGVLVACIWDTFYLLVFKVILGSLGALVSKWHVTRKQLQGHRAKLSEILVLSCSCGMCIGLYMGYL